MTWLLFAALIYLVIGTSIAVFSGTYFWFFTLLWPWPVAAEVVKQTTGEYPKWMPPL